LETKADPRSSAADVMVLPASTPVLKSCVGQYRAIEEEDANETI